MKLNLIGGLIVGLFSNLLFYGLFFAGVLRDENSGRAMVLSSAAHALVLILVLARHRSAYLPEAIPFAKLFGAGLFLSFVAGALAALGMYVFTTVVDPTYLPWVIEMTTQQLRSQNLPEAELNQILASLPSRVTPASYAFQNLLSICFTGLLLSLVSAALLRMRALVQQANGQQANGQAPAKVS
jgi:hypothetical protein